MSASASVPTSAPSSSTSTADFPLVKAESRRVHRLVLTGGPCGGKTTALVRVADFFEHLGWKVFAVPEAATILLGGGIKFAELDEEGRYRFNKEVLRTMLRIEDVYFHFADHHRGDQNVLVICDRGAMDPSAYMSKEDWHSMLNDLHLTPFECRENRYHHIVHMVTAADGAQGYYTIANNGARSEDIEQAMKQDSLTRNAWVGHPYVDIVDNSDCAKFDDKILKVLQAVCEKAGVDTRDRLSRNSKRRKWLVRSFDESKGERVEEFRVRHDYLRTDNPKLQVRLRRRRTQKGQNTYTLTTRIAHVETRRALSEREYTAYLGMHDKTRATLHKRRLFFTHGFQYFHLDVYVDPLPPSTRGRPLVILETHTTKTDDLELPPFVDVVREITDEDCFRMYNIAQEDGTELPDY